jgi:hypothetical protein
MVSGRLMERSKMNAKQTGAIPMFAMMFVIGAVYADNEIYIDQVGSSTAIEIIQDGSGNKIGGGLTDETKMLLSGDDMDINLNFSGSTNNLIGSVIGSNSVLDVDVTGSGNDLFFDVDKDNAYGATGGNYLVSITGGNNAVDFDFGSLDTANDTDFDFILDGDFNTGDINIDASSLTFNMDVISDNSNLDYSATGYDGHQFILTGTGNYWDIDVIQESTLQSDSLELNYDGSGTSTTDATICIVQSDGGFVNTCGQ